MDKNISNLEIKKEKDLMGAYGNEAETKRLEEWYNSELEKVKIEKENLINNLNNLTLNHHG